MQFYLSEINIYPIKSLGGISLGHAEIEERGLEHDRRWMLIDEEGMFITQRKYDELAMLQVSINAGYLTISHRTNAALQFSFGLTETTGRNIRVNIWDDVSIGTEVSIAANNWFSDFMKMKVVLVRMPSDEKRLVDPRYAHHHEIVSFADGYPCLLISQASLDGLNAKLEQPVRMDRFRPNFVFTGGNAHIEDSFDEFQLGDIRFRAVKPCARCVLITIDQQTGIKGKEPLKTLAGYRASGKKILFGQNLIHQGTGTIRVGDELKVVSFK